MRGVGKFMKRWKLQQDNLCHRCGTPEDAPYVWLCTGTWACEIWAKSLGELEESLKKMKTDPDVWHTIITYLQSWRDGMIPTFSANFLVQDLQNRQSKNGWCRFFEGWLAREWTDIQQAYYKTIKFFRTGKRWTVALIKKM
jgi:hypothetical protein